MDLYTITTDLIALRDQANKMRSAGIKAYDNLLATQLAPAKAIEQIERALSALADASDALNQARCLSWIEAERVAAEPAAMLAAAE